MSHKKLSSFIVKVSVLGYFPLYIYMYTNVFNTYFDPNYIVLENYIVLYDHI